MTSLSSPCPIHLFLPSLPPPRLSPDSPLLVSLSLLPSVVLSCVVPVRPDAARRPLELRTDGAGTEEHTHSLALFLSRARTHSVSLSLTNERKLPPTHTLSHTRTNFLHAHTHTHYIRFLMASLPLHLECWHLIKKLDMAVSAI